MQALGWNEGLSDVSASRNIRMFVDGYADGSPLDRPSHAGHRQEPFDGSPRCICMVIVVSLLRLAGRF